VESTIAKVLRLDRHFRARDFAVQIEIDSHARRLTRSPHHQYSKSRPLLLQTPTFFSH